MLVGATAAVAGIYAPISFLLAAAVVAFTGFSNAQLATRFPVSAGEAAYVRNGLRSPSLALIVGLMVAASGIISSAAVSIGAAGYLRTFFDLPPSLLTILVIAILGFAAGWGILESVIATALVVAIIVVLALFVPITPLAELTSAIVLLVFIVVNAALLRLKFRARHADPDQPSSPCPSSSRSSACAPAPPCSPPVFSRIQFISCSGIIPMVVD